MQDFESIFKAAKSAEELREKEREIAAMLREAPPLSPSTFDVMFWEIAAIACLGVIALILWLKMRRSHPENGGHSLPAQANEALNQLANLEEKDEPSEQRTEAMQALLQLNNAFQFNAKLEIGNELIPLTEDEHAIVRWIQMRISNDKTAAQMGVSLSKVYQLRAGLRSKLQLKRSQSLEFELAKAVVILSPMSTENA